MTLAQSNVDPTFLGNSVQAWAVMVAIAGGLVSIIYMIVKMTTKPTDTTTTTTTTAPTAGPSMEYVMHGEFTAAIDAVKGELQANRREISAVNDRLATHERLTNERANKQSDKFAILANTVIQNTGRLETLKETANRLEDKIDSVVQYFQQRQPDISEKTLKRIAEFFEEHERRKPGKAGQ